MIGLSLSRCIAAICRGEISETDVTRIITSTNCSDDESFEDVARRYSMKNRPWEDFADKAHRVLNTLRNSGRIEQPRLLNHGRIPFFQPTRIWVSDPAKITWLEWVEDEKVVLN